MNRLPQFIFFLVVVLGIYYGMHYYVFRRITHGLELSAVASARLRMIFLAGALLFFAGELMSRYQFSAVIKPVVSAGGIWLGALSIAVTVFIFADIARLVFHGAAARHFITISSLWLIFGACAVSLVNGFRKPVVTEVSIAAPGLAANANQLTIVQLSDLHLQFGSPAKWLDSVVEETNRLKPDVIVITGDLIDADICKDARFCAALRRLKAREGVYAITGNHEFYTGVRVFENIARAAGITVLRNRKVVIRDSIELGGIDDPQFEDASKSLAETWGGEPSKNFRILLSHRPSTFDAARRFGVNLQLSGHLHAGQIPPVDIIVKLFFKYPAGLYRKGNDFIYTSRGTGTWGPPMRLFSPSEIVRLKII